MSGFWELICDVSRCEACGLCQTRTQVVPGEGDPSARILLVGEGPGADEDRLGRPFVGASGQLLDGCLAAVGLTRRMVYIANVVKCRPPANRTPTPEEAEACLPFLRRQIALIEPRVILLLGGTAVRYLLGADVRVRRDHGRVFERDGIAYIPTYHPSALLREPRRKLEALSDFQALRDRWEELSTWNA